MPATDRRQQLLDTALEVFSRRGFEGATTKEIANAAGVNEAVIFRHFPNKQALYAAVLDYLAESSHVEKWLAEAKALMEKCDDAGLFRLIATAIIVAYRKDPRGQRVKLFAALEGHEQALAYFREASIPIYELLNDYILRRQREGAIADLPPGVILSGIAGMAGNYAMMTQMCGFDSHIPDEAVIQAFTRIMMRGVAPSAERT